MKISELWLREWVNPPLTVQKLANQLTMAGLEVDGIYPVAGSFDKVIVAQVIVTQRHPQADKLTVCEVDTGTGAHLSIVCGAANVRPGLKVALALAGAHLPGGIQIKESMLRGQLSQGMLCSVSELGIEDSAEGIMELAEDAPLGTSLRDYLALNDQLLDIDLTPNRADCFSVLGVVREIAALNQLTYQPINPVCLTPSTDERLPVLLSNPEACPQYCGRVIYGIDPQAKTPLWMAERLRRGGIRLRHPVVDVTNYVMLELGQPMHAFDISTIKNGIEVRFARCDETLVLLNGQEVKLDDRVLVIADQEKPLALAGFMGGLQSSVQECTTDIFLESAFFNPLTIAGVARRYGLQSDASQRFERGVDPSLQMLALNRATELLHEIVGGKVGPASTVSQLEFLPKKVTVTFDPKLVKQLSGLDIAKDEMKLILTRLGMVIDSQGESWQVEVPSHRFDITLGVDLVEEVVRMHGYGNLKAEPMMANLQVPPTNVQASLFSTMAMFFSSRGYREAINYSFVDPALQEALYPDLETMSLVNPISSELSAMRVSLWPGLLAAMMHNMHRQQLAIKLFETGVVFEVKSGVLEERACIAGLITGEHGGLNWCELKRPFDLFDVKGDLQSLFALLNRRDIRFVAATHPALHPGQSVQIYFKDVEVGWLGALHPRLLEALELTNDVLLFELSLKPITMASSVRYQPISKYPQVRRDLSLLVPKDVDVLQIESAVRRVVDAAWLKSMDVFDVYTGDSIPENKKSIAMALTLQDDHRTLVDEEITQLINAILTALNDEFDIILRD